VLCASAVAADAGAVRRRGCPRLHAAGAALTAPLAGHRLCAARRLCRMAPSEALPPADAHLVVQQHSDAMLHAQLAAWVGSMAGGVRSRSSPTAAGQGGVWWEAGSQADRACHCAPQQQQQSQGSGFVRQFSAAGLDGGGQAAAGGTGHTCWGRASQLPMWLWCRLLPHQLGICQLQCRTG
jgi:hypothetical protein